MRGQLRLREQQLFGGKSEAKAAARPTPQPSTAKKPRGQQPGQPGPKRRDHSHWPAVEEVLDLSVTQLQCSCRGLPLAPFARSEDSEILEVEVKPYRRVIRRRRSRRVCSRSQQPGIVTAPPASRVIPKSALGVSIWVEVLLDKFLFYRPTYRLLAEWPIRGLDLSLGTITDGLQRLPPLFASVYAKLTEPNQAQTHWHGDETRWLVFATREGKVGHRWWPWVFHSEEAVVFVLDQGQAHDVPQEHLGPVEEGILSVDRYSAYKGQGSAKRRQFVK